MSTEYQVDLSSFTETINRAEDGGNASIAEAIQMRLSLAIAERLEEIAQAFEAGYIETFPHIP